MRRLNWSLKIRVRAPSSHMESSGSDPDIYRGSSIASSNTRRVLSASNILQAPISALLEYSGILRPPHSNRRESEPLIPAGGHGQNLGTSEASGLNGEVSIRIIGAGEQEGLRDSSGLVVGEAGEVGAQPDVSVSLASSSSQGDLRGGLVDGDGITHSSNAGAAADAEAGSTGGTNSRDSSYQRYDIQQAARWIEQVLPFSLLLLVVFIRQHLQGDFLTSFFS